MLPIKRTRNKHPTLCMLLRNFMALSLTITKQRNLNWLLAILFCLCSFIICAPLLFYRIPIRLAATNAVVELAGGETSATMVWVIWIGIAVIARCCFHE